MQKEKKRIQNVVSLKNRKETPIELRSVAFTDIVEEMLSQNFFTNNAINPFVITITDFKTGARREMNFESEKHFKGFWIKVLHNESSSGRQHSVFYKAFHEPTSEREAFKYAFVKINVIEGGYQNHSLNENYEVSILHYNLICVNPKSIKNNCGIECINYLLGEKLKNTKTK